MSELARAVAYVFRRQGRDAMGRNEFKQALSFGLNWFAPAEAAQVLQRALAAGLLAEEGDRVRLAFPAQDVELPLDFRPSPRVLAEPGPPDPRAQGPGGAPEPPAGAAPSPAPAQDPVLEERVRVLRELAAGRLAEPVARLLARRGRGEDVREEAARLLAELQGQQEP